MKSVFDQIFFSALYSLSPGRGKGIHKERISITTMQTRRQPLITKQNQVICVYWFCKNWVLLTYYLFLHGLKDLEKLIFFWKKKANNKWGASWGNHKSQIIQLLQGARKNELFSCNIHFYNCVLILYLFKQYMKLLDWKISTFHPFLLLTINIKAFLYFS